MRIGEAIVKSIRFIYTSLIGYPQNRAIDSSRVQYLDEAANDYMYTRITEALYANKGLAACKFGSIELANIVSKLYKGKWTLSDYVQLIKGYPVPIYRYKEMQRLGTNAGFFPVAEEYVDRFVQLMLEDVKLVDILGTVV